MKVLAPGKLILSGEHAVVYGHPALAMAINRYVSVTATPHEAQQILFNLANLSYQDSLTFLRLKRLKGRIKEKYQRFVHGDFKIRDVLQKPVELAQFALTIFFEMVNIKLTQGIHIEMHSDIPIGCGMGSSAATVVSLMQAMAHHLEMNLSPETLFQLSLAAENMQHGYSSGLDLRVSLHGGCLYIKDNQIHSRSIPQIPMFLVNTGTPASTTGECVAAVAPYFKNQNIGKEFEATTIAMDHAIQQQSLKEMIETVQTNHTLLTRIGVVPSKVQQFLTEIEASGGAGKICGAGSVSGENAGVVLVITDAEATLMDLCARYHYAILPIKGESRGVHVV